MKRATKILAGAVAAIAIFFTTSVNAQNSSKLGIGLTAGIPTSDQFSFAGGIDARFQFDVSKQISIPITTGYTQFFGKSDYLINGFDVQDYGFIPVKAGVKVFFDESGSGLYGLAELGAAFGVTNDSGTSFIYSPAIGYAWSSGLDLGVKYEGLSRNSNTIGQVALRVAYGFGL